MQARRREWQESVDSRKGDRSADVERNARIAAQAEVPAARVAESQEWAYFQSLLQAQIDKARAEAQSIGPALLSPDTTSHDGLLVLKIQGCILQERIATLESVLDLPKQIIEGAKIASDWLEKKE